ILASLILTMCSCSHLLRICASSRPLRNLSGSDVFNIFIAFSVFNARSKARYTSPKCPPPNGLIILYLSIVVIGAILFIDRTTRQVSHSSYFYPNVADIPQKPYRNGYRDLCLLVNSIYLRGMLDEYRN